jgi:hypothetical protein
MQEKYKLTSVSSNKYLTDNRCNAKLKQDMLSSLVICDPRLSIGYRVRGMHVLCITEVGQILFEYRTLKTFEETH